MISTTLQSAVQDRGLSSSHFEAFRAPLHAHAVGERARAEREFSISVIREYEGLDDDWDGYDASAIAPIVIDNAMSILRALVLVGMASPEISPMPNGTIHFEWKSPLGEACLEIGKTQFSGYSKNLRVSNSAKAAYFQGLTDSMALDNEIVEGFVKTANGVLFGPKFSWETTVTSFRPW